MLAPADDPTKAFAMAFDFSVLLNGERCDAASLGRWLIEARTRTRALTDDLEGDRELGPCLPIVNPPLWEVAHIAWFQEFWCLRFRNDNSPAPSLIANADAHYNSAIAAHDTRWELPLLPWRAMQTYQKAVLERVLERIDKGPLDEQLCYFALLSLFHEDMHGEAFYFTRQTLGHAAPLPPEDAHSNASLVSDEDIGYPGGQFLLGAIPGGGFAFDNECWAHEVRLEPFAMAPSPVRMEQFAAFVEDAGYDRDELWSTAGVAWRDVVQARAPVYWRRMDGRWQVREFDHWIDLSARIRQPMRYVNAHEAEAFCRWAGRRLPGEAEWEFAEKYDASARVAPTRTGSTGAVGTRTWPAAHACWQWTTDAFTPYPGFTPGPYAEYSAPWFGDHRVLRGYSDHTSPRLRWPSYRNFFMPDRRDVRAGFRTCAL